MANIYKIDINSYISGTFPLALYVKRPEIFSKWEFIESIRSKEEGQAFFDKLCELPILLGEAKHG
jgi:hypothetical protein